MKKMKKTLSLLLVFALILSTILTESSFVSNAKAKIRLNKKKVTLKVGKKTKLKLKNYKKKVKWSSSKKKVATVNKKGVVTAKKKGTAKITAKAGKKKYICKVTVKARKISTVIQTPDVQPSSVPAVESTPQATETSNNQAATTPDATTSVTPVATPVVVPSMAPSITPEETPNETPEVTPTITPEETPNETPEVVPTSTPASEEMADIPKFLSFKTYEGEEIITEEAKIATLSLYRNASLFATTESISVETPEEKTELIETNWINKNEMVLLKLSYENKKRDSIVEIVLNDSDYGKKQIYTTAASVNKIVSSDTYYDEGRDSYITDVLLQMPATKSETERIVEIEETCFLRETVGKRGYADMSMARQTTVTLEVSENPIPSYSVYFNFTENEEDGYTVVSLTSNYEIPAILYIPSMYNGLPVTEIGNAAFEKATFKKLIVPSTVKVIGENAVQDTSKLEEVIMMSETVPDGYALNCNRIVVPKGSIVDYAVDKDWRSNQEYLYCVDEAGDYILWSDVYSDLRKQYVADFPKVTISKYNEGLATYGDEECRDNVVWDEENHTVAFNCKEQYNSGVVFNLNPETLEGVDLSEYRYIKCDIETDEQVMIKLLKDSGVGGIWTCHRALFEDLEIENWQAGRRTIYFQLSKSSALSLTKGLLIAPNKENAHIKVFGIEFTTTRDDLEPLPACTYNEIFPKVTLSQNNEAFASYNNNAHRTNVEWDEENHTVSYIVPEDGNGVMLNIDSVNRTAVDLSAYNYVKLNIEVESSDVGLQPKVNAPVESSVVETPEVETSDEELPETSKGHDFLIHFNLYEYGENTKGAECMEYLATSFDLDGKNEIYYPLDLRKKECKMQALSIGLEIAQSDIFSDFDWKQYEGKVKIHSIEFVTEKPEE